MYILKSCLNDTRKTTACTIGSLSHVSLFFLWHPGETITTRQFCEASTPPGVPGFTILRNAVPCQGVRRTEDPRADASWILHVVLKGKGPRPGRGTNEMRARYGGRWRRLADGSQNSRGIGAGFARALSSAMLVIVYWLVLSRRSLYRVSTKT